ncbi:MAG: helix-turn-helix domain-containing protein, partial [Thaumarchaeota archaeon]|nr:helix-turn-helix domain-containing protein [Nitrososphaerota archaeon]
MMSGQEELVRALRKLGLSEYEARAYIALVELGEADASEISRRSGVPRTRIYDVLGRLESAGIIQKILGSRPVVYSAIPPDRALEPLRRRLFDEVSEAIDRLKLMYASTKTIPRFNMILFR